MILDKILKAEVVIAYKNNKFYTKKVVTIVPSETFIFDEYTETYEDHFARYFLTDKSTNDTCEIFEYSLPTFLVVHNSVYDIDLLVSFGDTKYFYNREKLIYTVIGNENSYVITNRYDYFKQ